MIDRRFNVGDPVRVTFGSNVERERWSRRRAIGEVVEGREIAGQGYCIRVRWPDEDAPSILLNSGQFDPA